MTVDPEEPVVGVIESDDAGTAGVVPDLGALEWRRSYERSAIEKFALEVEVQRERLEAALDEAEARLAAAQAAVAERREAADKVISDLTAAARQELERVEAERDAAVAAIRVEAEEEASRLLDAARRAAASVEQVRRAVDPDGEAPGSGRPDDVHEAAIDVD